MSRAAYLGLVDATYHHRDPKRIAEYVVPGYVAHDPFARRGIGPGEHGTFHQRVLAQLAHATYTVADLLETSTRIAARYVVTGTNLEGTRVVVHGISINRTANGKLAEAWVINDYRDVGMHSDEPAAAEDLEGWEGSVITSAPAGSKLATYLAVTDAMYRRRDLEAVGAHLHPAYLSHDVFVPRGDAAKTMAFHRAAVGLASDVDYLVLDAFDDGDRLAVRYLVRAKLDGVEVTVPGISINQFEGGKLRRNWVMNRYGKFAALLSGAVA